MGVCVYLSKDARRRRRRARWRAVGVWPVAAVLTAVLILTELAILKGVMH